MSSCALLFPFVNRDEPFNVLMDVYEKNVLTSDSKTYIACGIGQTHGSGKTTFVRNLDSLCEKSKNRDVKKIELVMFEKYEEVFEKIDFTQSKTLVECVIDSLKKCFVEHEHLKLEEPYELSNVFLELYNEKTSSSQSKVLLVIHFDEFQSFVEKFRNLRNQKNESWVPQEVSVSIQRLTCFYDLWRTIFEGGKMFDNREKIMPVFTGLDSSVYLLGRSILRDYVVPGTNHYLRRESCSKFSSLFLQPLQEQHLKQLFEEARIGETYESGKILLEKLEEGDEFGKTELYDRGKFVERISELAYEVSCGNPRIATELYEYCVLFINRKWDESKDFSLNMSNLEESVVEPSKYKMVDIVPSISSEVQLDIFNELLFGSLVERRFGLVEVREFYEVSGVSNMLSSSSREFLINIASEMRFGIEKVDDEKFKVLFSPLALQILSRVPSPFSQKGSIFGDHLCIFLCESLLTRHGLGKLLDKGELLEELVYSIITLNMKMEVGKLKNSDDLQLGNVLTVLKNSQFKDFRFEKFKYKNWNICFSGTGDGEEFGDVDEMVADLEKERLRKKLVKKTMKKSKKAFEVFVDKDEDVVMLSKPAAQNSCFDSVISFGGRGKCYNIQFQEKLYKESNQLGWPDVVKEIRKSKFIYSSCKTTFVFVCTSYSKELESLIEEGADNFGSFYLNYDENCWVSLVKGEIEVSKDYQQDSGNWCEIPKTLEVVFLSKSGLQNLLGEKNYEAIVKFANAGSEEIRPEDHEPLFDMFKIGRLEPNSGERMKDEGSETKRTFIVNSCLMSAAATIILKKESKLEGNDLLELFFCKCSGRSSPKKKSENMMKDEEEEEEPKETPWEKYVIYNESLKRMFTSVEELWKLKNDSTLFFLNSDDLKEEKRKRKEEKRKRKRKEEEEKRKRKRKEEEEKRELGEEKEFRVYFVREDDEDRKVCCLDVLVGKEEGKKGEEEEEEEGEGGFDVENGKNKEGTVDELKQVCSGAVGGSKLKLFEYCSIGVIGNEIEATKRNDIRNYSGFVVGKICFFVTKDDKEAIIDEVRMKEKENDVDRSGRRGIDVSRLGSLRLWGGSGMSFLDKWFDDEPDEDAGTGVVSGERMKEESERKNEILLECCDGGVIQKNMDDLLRKSRFFRKMMSFDGKEAQEAREHGKIKIEFLSTLELEYYLNVIFERKDEGFGSVVRTTGNDRIGMLLRLLEFGLRYQERKIAEEIVKELELAVLPDLVSCELLDMTLLEVGYLAYDRLPHSLLEELFDRWCSVLELKKSAKLMMRLIEISSEAMAYANGYCGEEESDMLDEGVEKTDYGVGEVVVGNGEVLGLCFVGEFGGRKMVWSDDGSGFVRCLHDSEPSLFKTKRRREEEESQGVKCVGEGKKRKLMIFD